MSRLNYFWIVLAVFSATLITLWFYPPSADFNVENIRWNGASQFSSRMGSIAINTFEDIPDRPANTVLIVVPYIEFAPGELEQIGSYILGGGTLILMDDYGHGNEVLKSLDVDYRFDNIPLLDPLIHYKNEQFPIITNIHASPLTFEVTTLVFDHAVRLVNVPDTEIVARSSSFSFIDLDRDTLYDDDMEAKSSSVVAANTLIGEGRIITISDPSIIINGMIDMEDNYTIMANAVALGTSNPKVYFDQSHLPEEELSEVKSGLRTARNGAAYPAVLSVMVGAVLLITLRPLWARRR
ncbi:DUF4350 domain-containing protein [Chloroflexota bacterium]